MTQSILRQTLQFWLKYYESVLHDALKDRNFHIYHRAQGHVLVLEETLNLIQGENTEDIIQSTITVNESLARIKGDDSKARAYESVKGILSA